MIAFTRFDLFLLLTLVLLLALTGEPPHDPSASDDAALHEPKDPELCATLAAPSVLRL